MAAVVVGAKFYIESKYKEELDKGIATAKLFADVSYDDLTLGFDGSLDLEGLRVTPNGSFDTVSVKSVRLEGLDFSFHINGKSRLEKGEIPPRLSFILDQLKFPTVMYEQLIQEEECKSFTGVIRYSAAGFDEIVMNARLNLNISDPMSAYLDFRGDDQISSSNFSMYFDAKQANPIALATQGPPIQSMSYDYYLEEQAAKSMLDYCAKQFKLSTEQYLEKVVKSRKFMVNSFQADLGEKARIALADFLKGGKEVSISSSPSSRLMNPSFAANASPNQVLRMLNLNIQLEGESVAINTMNFGGADELSIEEDTLEDSADGESQEIVGFKRRDLEELMNAPDGTVQERSRPQIVKKKTNHYTHVSLNDARNYIDEDIRVLRTQDRSPIEGRLLGIEDNVLSIEIFKYGGVMTYTVPYTDVVKMELKKRR